MGSSDWVKNRDRWAARRVSDQILMSNDGAGRGHSGESWSSSTHRNARPVARWPESQILACPHRAKPPSRGEFPRLAALI